jgi:hypothetical protein
LYSHSYLEKFSKTESNLKSTEISFSNQKEFLMEILKFYCHYGMNFIYNPSDEISRNLDKINKEQLVGIKLFEKND